MSQDKSGSSTKNTAASANTMESILDQWRRERPDLDPSPMAVCGQVWRAGEILRRGVTENWANYGLDLAGSDVILTLRRQGRGATLSPSDLAKDMMLSTSAMTNRLDRLEQRGLIKRTTDPNDRRGLRIILTDDGFSLADEMVVTHLETEERLLSALSKEERAQIRQILSKIVGIN